ncbi:Chromosome partition protein Smc [Stieleria maiorica]|uniref:Chromosome partition protein Smc n=1 Tax=Stieleria maiorica TaxID=2795974 RepID=A0A5B9MAH6_9BACT|nr:FHA domain-containing protein [Stieleria maiorica]QEF96227.1 Chromosome partition protein Smc [Stieleria maiorica]
MTNDHNDGQSSPHELSHPHPEVKTVASAGHLSDGQSSRIAVIPQTLNESLPPHGKPSLDSPTGGRIGDRSTATAALEFRVIRPGAPVRRLRLTGNRYTFGSGEGCSIRLDDESLRPMHAVLLRDAHRILMRAYSVPLECNGNRVTESELRLGDIIRMGHYRFELLAVPETAASFPQASPRLTSSSRHPVTDARESFLRQRLTDLSQQWHARHAECEVRESRCDQRESELHGRETELWSRAESLQHRENHLLAQEAAVREIQATYAATQEELKSLRVRESEASEALKEKEAELLKKSELLRERQAELQRRQAEWQQREEQYAEHAAEAQRKLEQTQQQAQSASDAVGRMREEFSTLSEQLTELRERHSELQAREKHEQEEHERLRGELESARDQAIDAVAESEAKREATESELGRVSADLQSTREELARVREESQQCQQELSEKLRTTGQQLQATREEAEQSRRAAEEDQSYQEKRIGELEERLAKIQENREDSERATDEEIAELHRKQASADGARDEAEQARDQAETARQAAEAARIDAEAVADDLRRQITQLQESVTEATQEASQLRIDQEGANASIRQLELLVDQTQNNQHAQQDSWSQESDQLRQTIEDLSIQLAAANVELGQLQSANEALSHELAQASDGDQDAGQPAAIESEQFRILEQELESARQEIERLRETHAETVSRMESERQESESVLRQEIEQLRDEIASAQQAAQARIDEIVQDGDYQTADSPKGTTEQFVQSGDNRWRLESEQSVEQSSHLYDATEHGEAFTDESESEPGDWSQTLSHPDSDGDPEQSGSMMSAASSKDGGQEDDAQIDQSVSWHDEPPEQAIDDAIDDIEHNVEQAISDYDSPRSESPWPDSEDDPVADPATSADAELGTDPNIQRGTDLDPEQAADEMAAAEDVQQVAVEPDSESPLDWSAYMPGGEVGRSDEEVSTIGEVAQEDATDDVDSQDLAASRSEDHEPQGWATEGETASDDQHCEAEEYESTLQWNGPSEPAADQPLDTDEPLNLEEDAAERWHEDQHPVSEGLTADTSEPDADASDPEAEVSDPEAEVSDPEAEVSDPPAGSLAAMLIRDLAGDDDAPQEPLDQPVSAEQWADNQRADDQAGDEQSLVEQFDEELPHDQQGDDSAAASAEDVGEDGHQATFVMDSEIEFSGDDSGQEFEAWNFASPDHNEASATDVADHEQDDFVSDHADDDGVSADASEQDIVSQTALVAGNDTVVAADDAPEDDSIEAYMSRLLQRVQGDGSSKQASAPATPSVPVGEIDPKDSVAVDSDSVDLEQDEPSPPEPTIADSVPLVPRSQAPELSRNLSAMRELANQSARNAVARSIRLQARDTQMKAAFKLGLALGFATMGIAAFIFVTWSATIKFGLVGAFLVLAGVFGQEGYVLLRDARRRMALAEEQAAEEDEDDLADEDVAN